MCSSDVDGFKKKKWIKKKKIDRAKEKKIKIKGGSYSYA